MARFLPNVPRPEARAAMVSLGVGVVLLGVKFAAYFLTGSAAVFSDALEGIVNVAASGFAVYALWVAHRPADPDHPYGHGKIEFLSAWLEGGMMGLAGLVILVNAIMSFTRGGELSELNLGILLIALAGAGNAVVGAWLIRAGKRHGAIVLEADGQHLISDAVTSLVALAALAAVKWTGLHWLDPLSAVALALYVLWTAWTLLKRSADGLMDKQDTGDLTRMRRQLDAHAGPNATVEPRICSYHKLHMRHNGRYHWIDFHIVVPKHWNVAQAHDVATAIEKQLQVIPGEGRATAHVEPCRDAGCQACGASSTAASLKSFVVDV